MVNKSVAFLDLRVTDDVERRELLAAVDTVLQHGRIVMGPEVDALEAKLADACGRAFAVGVGSGTDAVFLGLKALGIGRGDEVITTALSWIATANAIFLTGATPVFADIQDDLNLDPLSIERVITSRTKAIVPVHYTGKVCNMTALADIAQKHNVAVVEDASQAFGAMHRGRMAGSFGTVACFSMNPMKVFAALGEAGFVVGDDPSLRERLVSLRYNGTINREICIDPSLNCRIDTVHAAMLLARMPRVQRNVEARRRNAKFYERELQGIVRIPQQTDGDYDVYYTYTIRTPRRDALKLYLESQGIETKIQHPLLMPDQPAYRKGALGSFPQASQIVKEVLSLPIHEKLTNADLLRIVSAVKQFFARTDL